MDNEYPSPFRSEQMSFVQLILPTEIAHDAVYELGELGNIQFEDMNPGVNPFQRSFIGELRRIGEIAHRVKFFTGQIRKEVDTVPTRPLCDTIPVQTTGPRAAQTFDELDVKLAAHEDRLIQLNDSYQLLSERSIELVEVIHVLKEAAVFFERVASHDVDIRASFDDSSAPLLQHTDHENLLAGSDVLFDLEFVAGTIERSRLPTLQRVLWRVLRGNMYMDYVDIQEALSNPVIGVETHKNVFMVFAHGEALRSKARKVAESLGANIYPIDSSASKRSDSLREIAARLEDLQLVLHNTKDQRRTELVTIGEDLAGWEDMVQKEKAVYEALNLMGYDARRRTFIAEGWCPTRDIPMIQVALRRVTEDAGVMIPPILHDIPTRKMPPTFHRTNKLTEAFQVIMDNYGIASYQEVNPGLFAVITFPFLFAVMFGDIGHGFFLFLAALWMILREKEWAKQDLGEITGMFFFGRYTILLMGAFSMYTGLIYNDIFSRTLHLWNSGWDWPTGENNTAILGTSNGRTYPFGLDPAWREAENALIFTNSYKMKMSVILGVIHMTFALCLQVPNHIRFKRTVDIWTNFVPQLLFLQSIFGYLVFCILYKWTIDWSKSPTSPPSLLDMLIQMFLSPGTVNPETQLYRGQGTVQVILLSIAIACVPCMLFVKPYLKYAEMKRIQSQGYIGLGSDEVERHASDFVLQTEEEGGDQAIPEDAEDDAGHDFGEVVIYQVIHTIEFCLGCISHTASYLRLWALSLAHAQLTEVFWSLTLEKATGTSGVTRVIIIVSLGTNWFFDTVGVLCIIEGLSAFLHALRLHWVEANSKHYEAGGYQFKPLDFSKLGEDSE